MISSQAIAQLGNVLSENKIIETMEKGLNDKYKNQNVLVLIPDHTRSLPLPFLFSALVDILHDTKQLDFLVALGTHPPLSQKKLNKLVGITHEERMSKFKHIGILNHAWDNPSMLTTLGSIEQDEMRLVAGERWHPSLPKQVHIRINKAVLTYDQIIILGPTFPHEVVGFSGGAKYLFPGISGAEMINATHWLGALRGVVGTIGFMDTSVRKMIHSAARHLNTPVTLIALTVEEHNLAGIFIGDLFAAWEAAAEFSSQRHIRWIDKPFQRVLSCAPPIYDELWTAAKAMYKIEPAVALGGEVIIHAPHLDTISHVHGKYIKEVGYHILDYFLDDWERFKHIPLGVLAHSTHLRGSGRMENGIEKPNVRVTLASKISPTECKQLNLGYLNPDHIDINQWINREAEGILYVPRAGEILYRTR